MASALLCHMRFEQTLPFFWTALCCPFYFCWNLSDLRLCAAFPSHFSQKSLLLSWHSLGTMPWVSATASPHSILTHLCRTWLPHACIKLPEGRHFCRPIMLREKAVHKASFNQCSPSKISCRVNIKTSLWVSEKSKMAPYGLCKH